MFIIFLLSGFWHGANWTFIIWGLIHAIVYCIYYAIWGNAKRTEAGNLPQWKTWIGGISTFAVVVLAWIFFRAKNVTEAWAYLKAIATNSPVGDDVRQFIPLLLLLIPFHFVEWINRNSTNGVFLSNFHLNRTVRLAIELVLALLIIDCYYSLDHEQFIYFQF